MRGPRAAGGSLVAAAAHIGLAARAFVYLLIAWLALQIARGHTTQQANQKGAVATIAQHHGGKVLLIVLGLGLACYALWRLSEAAFGTSTDGKKAGPRLKSLVRGVIYGAFAVTTFLFVIGMHGTGQAQQQETATARVMKHGYGRLVVAVAGIIVLLVGLEMIVSGVRKKFTKQLRMHELSSPTRTAVTRLGVVGNCARGAVFAIAGALVIDAAVRYQPSKSAGLDGAFRTLVNQPFGPVLVGLAAAGLFAFALFGLAEARWVRT
ncbi:MAG TPA: DUF1206 domain-containing protein [Jatrophihabitantaceae bacterium]|nr:DUF1206 domain-containing protein [Jatrophihabitantaceae bacterium]